MFLLANGLVQEQIAQILKIHRSTVASIISNQLCIKFGVCGTNTKILSQIAIDYGYHLHLPESLCSPAIIILDDNASALILAGV